MVCCARVIVAWNWRGGSEKDGRDVGQGGCRVGRVVARLRVQGVTRAGRVLLRCVVVKAWGKETRGVQFLLSHRSWGRVRRPAPAVNWVQPRAQTWTLLPPFGTR